MCATIFGARGRERPYISGTLCFYHVRNLIAPHWIDSSCVCGSANLFLPRFRQPKGIAMLFIYGEIVMRILSKRQLKELVLYSPQHVARLEKAGEFPKRIQLGPNRVGWVEAEVLEWLQTRLDDR